LEFEIQRAVAKGLRVVGLASRLFLAILLAVEPNDSLGMKQPSRKRAVSLGHNNSESFARLAWCETFSFAMDTRSVDGTILSNKNSGMPRAAIVAKRHGGEQIPQYCKE
jgi:hypothetical protein